MHSQATMKRNNSSLQGSPQIFIPVLFHWLFLLTIVSLSTFTTCFRRWKIAQSSKFCLHQRFFYYEYDRAVVKSSIESACNSVCPSLTRRQVLIAVKRGAGGDVE